MGSTSGPPGRSSVPSTGEADTGPGEPETFAIPLGGNDDGIAQVTFPGATVALALDGLDWQVPGLMLSVPGLVVVLVVGLQLAGGVAWLPIARRAVGSFGLGRRHRRRTTPG